MLGSTSLGVQAETTIVVSGANGTNSMFSSSSTVTSPPATAAAATCIHDRITPYEEARHKRVYKVGDFAIRGFDAAYSEFNRTYVDYLTATAGQRFDPPLAFELKPLNFGSIFTDTAAGLVDFIYANPSAFSCIESEFTAHSLVSQISRRKINGNVYHLKKFGGVIFRRHDNEDIQTIQDVRGKVVAAASISGLGSGQMQFLAMQQAGMSYINGMCAQRLLAVLKNESDPSEVVVWCGLMNRMAVNDDTNPSTVSSSYRIYLYNTHYNL